MTCRIDHITITSPSLEAGSEFVHERLGVRPQAGGEHPRMGTHNMLLRLGNAMFLEVISVDPAAGKPPRPRWFELDAQPAPVPKLACWVARTEDIRTSLSCATEPLGTAEPMTRGSLEWLISIPEDGSLPLNGTAPALIQWNTAKHPALSLQDQGCQLAALELLHPEPARLNALLRALAVAEPGVSLSVARSGVAGLIATIRTPLGLRTIGDPA
ncbi:VOC family protein [Noviherbaspirillum sp. CPCC 100848]|uniref:VOC family protein n=1 Tax=Noviherbaspirillum album TaxID=3080276 RepID=A0ABU6J3W8_9BURK|nr:VOC family protein [Noviherbaspirillum sp. CPCC 100848]MEC4717899.1 VOC family protein [Noviherbaspirillum sp. CPCC 100848]